MVEVVVDAAGVVRLVVVLVAGSSVRRFFRAFVAVEPQPASSNKGKVVLTTTILETGRFLMRTANLPLTVDQVKWRPGERFGCIPSGGLLPFADGGSSRSERLILREDGGWRRCRSRPQHLYLPGVRPARSRNPSNIRGRGIGTLR
jgi:hypothetical protein